MDDYISEPIPVGTVIFKVDKYDLPLGRLWLDGSMIYREEYPELFAVLEAGGNLITPNAYKLPNHCGQRKDYSQWAYVVAK